MRNRTAAFLFVLALRLPAQTGPGGVGNSTNNVLWLSADVGVTTVGTSVTNWTDRSGNANHATSPSVAARPTLVPAALNNYPIITFDGANDELRIPDANSLDLTQWDIFLVNSVSTAKNNNAWFAKGTSTQPNYALWSTATNALTMPIYDILFQLSAPSTAAGITGGGHTVLQYNNTVYFGLFPARNLYRNGTLQYNDLNLLQLPRTNNAPFQIGNVQGTAGWNLNGTLPELIIYNAPLNAAQRIIVGNYLAAKYGTLLSTNDIYIQDNPLNGNYDHEVAGIGRAGATAIHNDARGSGAVHINNPTGLGTNEFLLWGHDNGPLSAWNSTDFPTGLQGRWRRVWRVNEVSSTGTPVDVGNVDMTFDLTDQGPVTASDLRLLVDINNNGIFADDAPVPIAATALGGNLYRFAGVSQLVNGRRFTLGTINYAQTPLPIELLYFTAELELDRTVRLEWATASERMNALFIVQRSANGTEWEPVVEVPGAGNSSARIDYTEQDPSPHEDLSYYRLQQIDADGACTFSDVVPVQCSASRSMHIYPHPAWDVVNVAFDATMGVVGIRLTTELGGSAHAPFRIEEGRAWIEVAHLPTGQYMLQLIGEHEVRTERLIIAR